MLCLKLIRCIFRCLPATTKLRNIPSSQASWDRSSIATSVLSFSASLLSTAAHWSPWWNFLLASQQKPIVIRLKMLIKVQNLLEARSEYDLLIENYLRNQFSFSASTRTNDRYEARWIGIFFVYAFGPGMMYPMEADSNARTPEW